MKLSILSLICLPLLLCAQPRKDSLLIAHKDEVRLELKMMFDIDQALRSYDDYSTFDTELADSISQLSDAEKEAYYDQYELSDSLYERLWDHYIRPVDERNTLRLIELTKKYGYPSQDRFKQLTGEELGIMTYVLFVHSDYKKYKAEILKLVEAEIKRGNFTSRCEYGHLLWHLNGRTDMSFFLDNGYKMVKDGERTSMQPVDCDFD